MTPEKKQKLWRLSSKEIGTNNPVIGGQVAAEDRVLLFFCFLCNKIVRNNGFFYLLCRKIMV